MLQVIVLGTDNCKFHSLLCFVLFCLRCRKSRVALPFCSVSRMSLVYFHFAFLFSLFLLLLYRTTSTKTLSSNIAVCSFSSCFFFGDKICSEAPTMLDFKERLQLVTFYSHYLIRVSCLMYQQRLLPVPK